MSELISRQKLIESIKKWQKEAEPEEARVMEDIICLINDQPPADLPWIPVSSGTLPETGQQIFATCEQEGETDVMEIYYNSELLVPPWRMTAWMPAEPYKGVE